ncbi:hypothetical protein ANO11243_032390 [Dothideomycetidae sp. 11243]|nr:hypothetical protein ANO11243_032390 [fungal sp. No.11243]
MAMQPDINAILAALAAQNRTASTPSQSTPVPSALPPGFPGAIPQQGGTPSAGGFALPQPTNSGSVDLSSVRPVSTGSVSIAEAIAKARSIAADKNISGARDDPRLSGRPYRRSRSRSRSPGRRDAFRDNHNPYRDERRGEERRGGYGRDRSRSPGRGQASYSPRDDKDSETITVKSALVGLIIGRAGENLRRVESETGARVQFVPAREPGAAQRQCTISGTLRQREAAKREIFQTIEDNGGGGGAAFDTRGSSARASQQPPSRSTNTGGAIGSSVVPEGEVSRQILVPDKTVGLIIGRGGETIRDIQDRSGCHINIVGENKSIGGRRPVNLIGSKESADKAEALIWEIVDSDTRGGQQDAPNNNAGPGRRAPDMGSFPPQARGFEDNDKATESIFVPSEAVGMIIGKGGESIKEMQNQTGCKINVNQPGNPDVQRKIDLVGSRSSIEGAKRVIWEKVDTVIQRDRASGRNTGRERDGYSQQPQHQQPAYGQPMQPVAQMPVAAPPAAAAPAGGDPNAPDPYAQYGGYQNYMALWWAAMQQQQQGQPPQAQ